MNRTYFRSRLLALISFLLWASPAPAADSKESLIPWQPWSDAAWAQARRENKLVILDLEAVWCHWCHVMDEKTYHDPKVADLIKSKFVAIRVDQDARPDVSKQYENWGWPATIIFGPDGQELVKRAGYIPPVPMLTILQAVVADPTPGPSARQNAPSDAPPVPPSEMVKDLRKKYADQFDQKEGAWGFTHKFLDAPSTEYALEMARRGDMETDVMARKTLDGQLNLLDPSWGGMYQYSTGGVWTEPHFEKIMPMQTENIRVYSLAFRQYKDQRYLEAALAIYGYLNRFLKDASGAFYTSQDADVVQGEHGGEYFALLDAERVKQGIPRVDKHMYARENGWVIGALTELYAATGDEKYLNEARIAAKWVKKNRSLGKGGFSHDKKDAAGPYLGDTLAMGQAFYALYSADGDRAWLDDAEAAARFIRQRFASSGDGFLPYAVSGRTPLKPQPNRDENIAAARFFIRMFHATGRTDYRDAAESAFRYLTRPDVINAGFAGPILLVEREMSNDPIHLTTVGGKKEPAAKRLHQAALFYPSAYKRVEWWDRKEGPLPNTDVEYPVLDKPAAFACANGRCSLPAYTPEQLATRAKSL